MDINDVFGFTMREEVKPKKEMSKEKKSKKEGTKKNESKRLQCPVTVYGRNFRIMYEGEANEETTLEKVCAFLYQKGIMETGHKEIKYLCPDEHTVILCYPKEASAEDTFLAEEATIAYGETCYPLKAEDAGVDPAEFSIGTVLIADQGIEGCRQYNYDPSSRILVPVFEDASYPEDCSESEFYAGRDRKECPPDAANLVECLGELPDEKLTEYVLKKDDTGMLYAYIGVSDAGRKSLSTTDRSYVQELKKDAVQKNVPEFVNLPVLIKFHNIGDEFTLSAEEYGRDKDSLESVLKWVKTRKYKSLNSSDRKLDVYYDKESGRISIAAFSGKKG